MQRFFDHEKLDVYQVSIEFVGWVESILAGLGGHRRHARDQLIRASESIPLNIAEGNGKRGPRDRKRYFEIARGSAMECAAALDVLVATGAKTDSDVERGKELLHRIAAMLTKMTQAGRTRRPSAEGEHDGFERDYDYDYEHEREHEA